MRLTLGEFGALFRWSAAAYVAGEQGGRFGFACSAAPHAAVAELAECDRHQLGRGLHDARVLIAQAPGQRALHLDWIVVGNVELKIRHGPFFLGIEVTASQFERGDA